MEDSKASGITLTEFRTRVLFKALNMLSVHYGENWYQPATSFTSFVELDKYWRLRYPLVFEEAEDEVLLEETKRRMNLTGDTK